MALSTKLKPAQRVSNQRPDVWTMINDAAAASPKQPIVNLGQGFFGYNPPDFILNAAKDALDRVECNQYSPTKGRPRLKKAIADAYTPFWSRSINPDTEVTITTGANEGMLSAFMAFVEPGDEVIVFEPFFDQYISNIEFAGGHIRYVPMYPPKDGGERTSSAGDWTIDFDELERAVTPKTKMIVLNTPRESTTPPKIKTSGKHANRRKTPDNPVGKVYTKEELQKIGDICVRNDIIILSDEVYDRLFYVPFTRIATLSPEIEKRTLTVGSAGKNFYATGWRVGWLIGPADLIQYVSAAHTRICYSSVSPLQEACAVGFEQAQQLGFWDATIRDMQAKMARFNSIWTELGLPFSDPEGGYFVLVNLSRVQLPPDYPFPASVAARPRDFRFAYWLIQEFGVAAIPPTEFYTAANAHVAQDYLRFAVCKDEAVLDEAKERLRGLKAYIKP